MFTSAVCHPYGWYMDGKRQFQGPLAKEKSPKALPWIGTVQRLRMGQPAAAAAAWYLAAARLCLVAAAHMGVTVATASGRATTLVDGRGRLVAGAVVRLGHFARPLVFAGGAVIALAIILASPSRRLSLVLMEPPQSVGKISA